MKILLDIQDNKAAFIMELLKNFTFVKTTTLSDSKVPTLTKAQKDAIDQGLRDLEEGRTSSHEEVMEETKKRYPNLLK
jgi:predicted transcriptional regulator